MAEVRLLFMDPLDGFPSEIDPTADSITLNGLTMGGDVAMGGNQVTGLADGSSPGDAVTFSQFESAINGLDYKDSVRVASVGTDLGAAFSAVGGTEGKGQLTAAPATVDGVVLAQGDRVLVKDQTAGLENGVYVVTVVTTVWDRALDFDDDPEVTDGATTWVGEGTLNADSRYTLSTNDPIVVNTTGQTWVQTAGSGSLTGGDGIDISGSVVSVDLLALSGLQFNTGQLGVLLDPASALGITGSGLTVSVGDGLAVSANNVVVDLASDPGLEFSGGDLRALVNPAGAIERVTAGLGIVVDGVTIQINGSNQLEVIGAGDANRLSNSFTAQVGLSIGDPLFATNTDNEVGKSDASVASSARRFIGIAKAAALVSAPVDVISDGLAEGVLTGSGFTAGEPVFIASGGGLADSRPSGSGDHVYYLGRAVNSDDLLLQPQYFGRVA